MNGGEDNRICRPPDRQVAADIVRFLPGFFESGTGERYRGERISTEEIAAFQMVVAPFVLRIDATRLNNRPNLSVGEVILSRGKRDIEFPELPRDFGDDHVADSKADAAVAAVDGPGSLSES